ncbi:hypothetical protein F5888DRAFT_1660127 [Russula emetica]|nr:hypothetical protein F5888DRAFT_1660127 [Russula emetica]
MPSSTLQARIKAFEAIGSGASKEVLDSVAIHTEPEHLLDRPHSPSAASIPPIVPTTYSPSASPNSLRHRTSLLDLKDWVIDDGPFGASPTTAILTGSSPLPASTPLPHESAPLISFDGSPPKFVRAPPLPPRKLSFNSPRSVSAPAASPTTSPSNNMLMPPSTDPLALKDLSPSDGMRRAQGHMHASSVSSFHSVSLSSDGGDDSATTPGTLHAFPMEREWTGTGTEDGESLDESFENVSAPSSFLPSPSFPLRPPSVPPGKPALLLATKQPPPPPPLLSQPPRLPQRPIIQPRGSTNSFASHSSSPSPVTSGVGTPVLTRTNSASSSSHSHQTAIAIPPCTNAPRARSRPPSARTSVQSTATTSSDRSSLFSQGTTTSRSSISSRMTSISASASTLTPLTGTKQTPAARVRYDAVFSANVRTHAPKAPPPPVPLKRQNAGWRGLSIDVPPPPIPASPAPPAGPSLTELGLEARLDGRLVRAIWLKSRLETQRLRGIWNECDPDGTGSLDREAFVRGMARIDEELRRAQLLGRARAPRPVPSRPILR